MKHLLSMVIVALVLVLHVDAQQPQQRLNQIVRSSNSSSAEPQEKNFQLELSMTRDGKTARYRMAFNGGQISTDLLDKLSDQGTNTEPKTISFTASYSPFDDGGGELTVFVGRTITYRTKASGRGENPDREVVQQRNMGLNTKVALRPDKAVVIFDDENEKISLKLAEL